MRLLLKKEKRIDMTKIQLVSKQLPKGGFPLELKNAITINELVPRGTYADWGISGKTKMNEYITVDSLDVLKKANRG
jgi:hypothetical protein